MDETQIPHEQADAFDAPSERVYNKVISEVVTITPTQAAEWLKKNLKNRHERRAGTLSYSGDMADNEWMLTGDTIKFDWFGNLIDGQHRLQACVASGVTFHSVVVWGVNPKAQDRVDSGMVRAFKDQLMLRDVKYAQTVAAVCRRIHLWEPPRNERISFSGGKISHAKLEQVFEAHPEVVDCAEFGEVLSGNGMGLYASQIAFFYWVLMQANPQEAAIFIHKLATGVDLGERDPILVLREWIRRARGENSRSFEGEALWKTAMAWNAWMAGRRISKLQLPKGGRTQENFPVLRERRKTAEVKFDKE